VAGGVDCAVAAPHVASNLSKNCPRLVCSLTQRGHHVPFAFRMAASWRQWAEEKTRRCACGDTQPVAPKRLWKRTGGFRLSARWKTLAAGGWDSRTVRLWNGSYRAWSRGLWLGTRADYSPRSHATGQYRSRSQKPPITKAKGTATAKAKSACGSRERSAQNDRYAEP